MSPTPVPNMVSFPDGVDLPDAAVCGEPRLDDVLAPDAPAREVLAVARAVRARAGLLAAAPYSRRARAERCLDGVRRTLVRRRLAEVSLDALGAEDARSDHLQAMRAAGFLTVADLLAAGSRLSALPRFDPSTIGRMVTSARSLAALVEGEVEISLDEAAGPRDEQLTDLVAALAAYERAQHLVSPLMVYLEHLIARLEHLIERAAPTRSPAALLLSARTRRGEAREALDELRHLLSTRGVQVLAATVRSVAVALDAPPPRIADLWRDVAARADEYRAIIAEISARTVVVDHEPLEPSPNLVVDLVDTGAA